MSAEDYEFELRGAQGGGAARQSGLANVPYPFGRHGLCLPQEFLILNSTK